MRASHRKRSQTPVSLMTRDNNVTTSSRSQSRSTRHQRNLNSQPDKYGQNQASIQIIQSLYVKRFGYGSQSKSIWAGVMWSNRFKSKIKQAAEFNTDCSWWTSDGGKRVRTLLQQSNRDYEPRHAPRDVLIQQIRPSPICGSATVGNNSSGKRVRHAETLYNIIE